MFNLNKYFHAIVFSLEKTLGDYPSYELRGWDISEEKRFLHLDFGSSYSDAYLAYDPINFSKDNMCLVFSISLHPFISATVAGVCQRELPEGFCLLVNAPYFRYGGQRYEGHMAEIVYQQSIFDDFLETVYEWDEDVKQKNNGAH